MKTRRGMTLTCATLWLVTLWAIAWARPAIAQQEGYVQEGSVYDDDNIPAQDGVQVLSRGPVHEAFAETVNFNPQPGPIVPKAPPPPIDEVPPDQEPEGVNVDWIPGYWAWDMDSNDYIWISGVWRDVPPGREWVPGYWSRVEGGYQWTSGYWADADTDEIEYLPRPPQVLETEPSGSAPSPDDRWFPGTWMWRDDHYVWRAGYWAPAHEHWVWVPAYYNWTPRGYVFIDGYWDFPARRRGVLFAPVQVDFAFYRDHHFRYRPTAVVNLTVMHDHLFVRPRDCHYYFGDYYATRYRDEGIVPVFAFHRHDGYDPIYAHQRWEHRDDHDWEQRYQAQYDHRRDNESERPAHTLSGYVNARREPSHEPARALVQSLNQWARSANNVRLQRLGEQDRQRFAARGSAVQQFRDQRQKIEARPATDAHATPAPAAVRTPAAGRTVVKMPRSPIVGKPAAQLRPEQAPPKPHVVPRPSKTPRKP